MSREIGDLLEQTARGPCGRDFDPADIAVKARRQRRWGAVAAAAVVIAALVGGAAWVRLSMDANPQAPFVDASPPVGVAQEGWQTVPVGSARLSVPQDWAVIDLRDDPTAYCTMFKGTPSLYLGPAPQPPPSCPNSLEDPVVGVHAVGFAELGGWFDGEPVEVNGHDGVVTDDDGQTSSYVFPDLALMLEINYGPDPQLAEQVLSTLRRAEGDAVEPSPAQPSAARSPTELDPGRALTVEGLPAMGFEGVSVQTEAGLVFVGIDGTVHGHLPDAALGAGGPAMSVPGPIPVDRQLGPDEDPTGTRLWVQPASGSWTPRSQVTAPLRGSFEVVEPATAGDPSPLVLRTSGAEEIARFSANLQWNVSAHHRTVSWHECPDGGRDLSQCSAHAYDTDMGAELNLEPGCWVSDSFADFNHAVVCWQGWASGDDESWIELRGPGQDSSRLPLPRYNGQPDGSESIGHYTNAFLAGENVVATWSSECEVPRAVVAGADGQPRPLLGDNLATAPAAKILGVAHDGRAVVHVLDSPQCGQAGPPGIHLIDPNTDATTPIMAASGIQIAEMWTDEPRLNN